MRVLFCRLVESGVVGQLVLIDFEVRLLEEEGARAGRPMGPVRKAIC